MDALLLLGWLVALAALAPRLGADSRDHFMSKEEWLAHRGFHWGPGHHEGR